MAYAEFADMLWWETSHPDLDDARKFAEAVHKKYPGKLLAYNCSPSFNWRANLDEATIAKFQRELGAMGYKFQFVTLAGFHALNQSMFDLADRLSRPRHGGLFRAAAGANSPPRRAAIRRRVTSAKSAPAISTPWPMSISGGKSSTTALANSTEAAQFHSAKKAQAAE